MSSLTVSHDSHLMLLEFIVSKLFVPHENGFEEVVMCRNIVTVTFLDNNKYELTPQRPDLKEYQGSNLEDEPFHGGQSFLFSIPTERIVTRSKGARLDVAVRKEISEYFECEHTKFVGAAIVDVDPLFNGIRKELGEREELKGYLKIKHERSPISRSMKQTYDLITDSCLKPTRSKITLFLRLSHLGSSIITEIERPFLRGCHLNTFYAQEETNLAQPYELRELCPSDPNPKPDREAELYSRLRNCELHCCCTPEQAYRARYLRANQDIAATCTSEDVCTKSLDEPPCPPRESREVCVGPCDLERTRDVATECQGARGGPGQRGSTRRSGRGDDDDDADATWRGQGRRKVKGSGLGPGVFIDKSVNKCGVTGPVCAPCPIDVCALLCENPCAPVQLSCPIRFACCPN